MSGSVREPPREFEAKLRAMWPDFRRIEWDHTYSRWRFFFTSAAGRECSTIYCWDRNPITGGPASVDPMTGLRPFRDLDADAQREIIYHGERTSLTNPYNGPGTWENHTIRHMREQKQEHATKRAHHAEDYAYALQQVDLRRPWVKDHQPKPKGSGVRMGYGGAIKEKNVRPKGLIRLDEGYTPGFGKGRKSVPPTSDLTGAFA